MRTIVATVLSASSLVILAGLVDPIAFAQQPQQHAAPAWHPDDAADVLLMVKGFYDATDDLQASFEQRYWNPTFNEDRKLTGKLEAKKPGKMVWDQRDQADADYYTDGNTLWMVEHDTRQVIKTDVSGNPELTAALQFLFGGETLVRDHEVDYAKPDRVKRYGDADHYVLELRPKRKLSKHYKGLVLVVHASTGRVDGLVVYNTDGSNSHYRFSKIRTNLGLADDRFVFRRPKDYVETVEP